MRGSWSLWWIGALVAPWGPTLGLGAAGGRVWLGVTALAALLLGAVTPVRRDPPERWLAAGLLGLGLAEAWRWRDLLAALPWLYVWGAWWDTAGWWLLLGLASVAVRRHARPMGPALPIALLVLLSAQLGAYALERWAGISRWTWSMAPSGLLGLTGWWAAWCAISWPVLWAWRRWAVLPAALGLLLVPTSSVLLAGVLAWLTTRQRPVWQWLLGLLAAALAILWQEPLLLRCLDERVMTWATYVRTLREAPWGIGWGPGAERLLAAHATGPILPHAASDWLALPVRYGWWTLIPWLGSSCWLWTRPASPTATALRLAWWLAWWQTSVSVPVIGALVWVLWLTERQGEDDGEPESA